MIRFVNYLAPLGLVAVLLGAVIVESRLEASPRTPTTTAADKSDFKSARPSTKKVRLGNGYSRNLSATIFGPNNLQNAGDHSNFSYLNDTKKNLELEERTSAQKEVMGFQYQLLNDGQVLGYRERLRAQQRDEEIREHHHLEYTSDSQLPENRRQQQKDLGAEIARQVGSNTSKVYLRRLRRAAENDPNLSRIRTPAAIIVGAVAISQGQPVKWDVFEGTRLTSTTRVQNTESQLDLSTKYVDTSMCYRGRVSDVAPWDGRPGETDERLRLSLSRSLPWIDTNSSVSYGTSSNTVSAALSRPILVPNLTAILDTTRTVGQRRLAYESDQRVRLNYSINF